jgi:DHA1 family bicyclomycin/chloramphenicol resistance-like MFS transporter
MVAAISPLAMNVFLPALADIADYFQTNTATAQLAVTLFLAATAVMQLVFGPISDRYGRRPVMLCMMVFMLGATLLAIYAPSIEVFLLARVLQASAAAGMVLSRAIVRDVVGGDQAASMIGYVTMGMTLAPMLGPPIGGLLAVEFGWQASFWLIFAFTAIVLVLVYFDLEETNPYIGSSVSETFKAWPKIIRSHRFWGYAACLAFSSGAFFAFLGAAPLIAILYYKMTPAEVGFYFFYVAVGYMVGNFLAGRFSSRVGLNNMMLYGNIIAIGGLLAAFIFELIFTGEPLAFFFPIFFLGLGNGITLPNSNAGIVNVRPENAGAASGLGGSLQVGGGALLAAATGYGLSLEDGPFGLLTVMMISLGLAIIATFYVMHIDRLRRVENR